MKKIFTHVAALALFLAPVSTTFGQTLKSAGQQLGPVNKGIAGTTLNHSPNFNHQHDGEHCLSDALTNHWIQEYGIEEQYKAEVARGNQMAAQADGSDRATYTIPIIFHVVHNPNNPSENVSEAAINALLDAVNEDFTATNSDVGNLRTGFGWSAADADIEFCLAQKDPQGQQLAELGIHRVETTEDYYNPDTETNEMKYSVGNGGTGTEVWDRNSYVNVWICDITNGASSGTAGYAYKPTVSSLPPASIDGIVIDYNLGMPPTNRVLTHELGHYLGLSHTWGNSNQASGCSQDDGLADTPNTAGPSFNYGGSCGGSQQTCPGTETQYENYMDYSNCTVIFTQDQADLMQAVLTGSRNSLNASDACTPVNPQPPVTDFVADITTVIEGGSINFTDLSTNYPTGWTWTVSAGAGETYISGTDANSQNPVIQFANAGTYTITLNASNAYGNDDEVKTNYITVVASGGGTTDCDTLRNYTGPEEANMTAYSITGADGYYPGHVYIPPGTNSFQLYNIADSFSVSAPTEVRRLRLPIFQADDLGAANDVTFTVWDDNGATPGPGTVLGTETVAISDLNAGFWNIIDFTTPVSVNGEFWVGMQLEYPTTGVEDTVLFATTNFSDRPSGPSTTWMQGYASNIPAFYVWQSATSFFTSNPDCSLILDVLTSNGPAPTAVAAWPDNETCEGQDVSFNGFASLNTTSYYWDLTDGTDDYFATGGNVQTPFAQGTWTINLEADGSCLTDIDGPFVLTVNPPLSATFNNVDENCIAQDGEINITVTGGNGGPYNYSINNGTTTETTGAYTGLNSGDYNYIITDNANCELTGVTTVGNANTFAPTITPDMTIAAGTPTDLTVTGGVSWNWYANEGQGPIQIGTTQTISVAPTVTTTYTCNVTDGSGCEAELFVTLTVDASGSVTENWTESFEMYPNPTDGQFALIFGLNQARDMDIEIVNIVGQQVFNRGFEQVQNQTINFDLSEVAAGVYFVNIQSGDQTVSRKIVVR